MYQIFCDKKLIHDSRSDTLRVLNPKCQMELSKTGTLSFSIAPNHKFYDDIKKLDSEISLFVDGEWLFTGRVLNDEIDFRNFKNVEVEGELAYLLDSIQYDLENHKPKVYHIPKDENDCTKAIKTYLEDVISIHNAQVEDKKHFQVGRVSVEDKTDQLYKISNYEDTLTLINDRLINTFKGYFICRNVNDVKYIDYLTSNDFVISNQVIKFGKNLINMTRHLKGEEIATCIIPLGATSTSESTTEGDTIDAKLTIADLDDETDGTIVKQGDYIYDSEAVAKFGWIRKVIEWDDVTEPSNLLQKAKVQLEFYKKQIFEIELTAVDLHAFDVNIDSIKLGQKLRVYSKPHDNLDEYLIVKSIDLDLEDVSRSTITLMTEDRVGVNVSSGGKKMTEQVVENTNYYYNNDNNSGGGWNDNYYNQINDGISNGDIDLSDYARVSDVNDAFNELATLIGGI